MSMSFEPGAPGEAGFIPLCVPAIQGNEWTYIKDCLDTGWVSSVGSYVDRFEKELAGYAGCAYAVAAATGTAALHIALLVAGVQPDDEVLVSTLSFIAPANAIRYCGAWPVLMDAEPVYWQMDPQKVSDFLTQECTWQNNELHNKVTGRRVKAIVPVHILGHPVNIAPIIELARQYNLAVVEDATESLGAEYQGQPVGCLGDVACFSFNGNKLITSGGGGMVVTNNEAWARRAKYLTTQAKDDPVEFAHGEVGYNYRLTNIQAAMGCAQLEKLAEYIAAKRRITHIYNQAFKAVPGITPMPEAEWAASVFWMYTILVDEKQYGLDSRGLLAKFDQAGVQTRPLWRPIHLNQPYQSSLAYRCEVAPLLHRDALSLPCSVGLSAGDQEYVIQTLLENN